MELAWNAYYVSVTYALRVRPYLADMSNCREAS